MHAFIHQLPNPSNRIPSTLLPPQPQHPPPRPSSTTRILLLPPIQKSPLIPLPPPRLHIPPTSTAANQAKMYHPPKNAKRSPNPHKRKHLRPDLRANIQARLRRNHIAEDDKHHGPDNRAGRCEQGSDERPYREREFPPPRVQRDGRDEDAEEVHAHACEEAAEHDAGGDLDQVEDVVDVGGERDGGAG